MSNHTESINLRVCEAIANGERVIRERTQYLQHLLREHPNVCRQTLRNTDQYVVHAEPCGCPSEDAVTSSKVAEGMCCYIVQPASAECGMCGSEVTEEV
jgi:hypothetical protein